MEQYQGMPLVKGITIGRIFFYSKKERTVKREMEGSCEGEIARYEQAAAQATAELAALREKAAKAAGDQEAAIFDGHLMMLSDEEFVRSVKGFISSWQVSAEYAVASAGDSYENLLSGMDDPYFKERAADVRDITDRLLTALSGVKNGLSLGEEPVLLAASELTPGETVQMDREKLLGFVTEYGSVNSHMAILARTMNIPAVSGISVRPEWDGRLAALDGFRGILYLDPDEKVLAELKELEKREKQKKALLSELKGRETVTADGRKIHLFANIGSIEDAQAALEYDAEGVGLLRSEFLYLNKNDYPAEEEQFNAYRAVAEKMQGKRVVIRTLDIGADKQTSYFNIEKEDNPAMGHRAIRICLDRPEIFKTQLRAIFRAGIYGDLAVMYPMITSVSEVRQAKALAQEVKRELEAEGIPYKELPQGVMIETPAAALISDLLAEEADFFSVGTNDLTQYVLAIDRQNPYLDRYYDPYHPAVLRLIGLVVKNGHAKGCPVGICGELAADTAMTGQLVQMGVDELSVAPASVLSVRKAVLKSNYRK